MEGTENNITGNSVREKILAFQNRTETPSPPTMTKDTGNKTGVAPLLMPKPSKSLVIPPKKPARAKLPVAENNNNNKQKDSSSLRWEKMPLFDAYQIVL